jgi:hypothetical protein
VSQVRKVYSLAHHSTLWAAGRCGLWVLSSWMHRGDITRSLQHSAASNARALLGGGGVVGQVGQLYNTVAVGYVMFVHYGQRRCHPQPTALCSCPVWHMASGRGLLVGQVGKLYSVVGCRALWAVGDIIFVLLMHRDDITRSRRRSAAAQSGTWASSLGGGLGCGPG